MFDYSNITKNELEIDLESTLKKCTELINDIKNDSDPKLENFNNLEKIPNKLRHKFNFIHAQSKYFDDVSSYAANPKREELIEEAKDLVTNKGDLAPRKQANRIHALQGKWQLLDQSSKSASRNQWESFKQLIDKAWEPCAEFFEELNEVKKNNAQNRLKLIEEIKQFAAKANNKDSIQYLSRFLKNAFTKWQNYSPVSDNDFKKLKKEFSEARKPIFDLIRSIEETNKKLKENLIEEVKNFVAEDSNTGISFFKDIKQKFKAIGPAGFKAEKVLWDEFHKAGDKFFEEEKALQKEQINLIYFSTPQRGLEILVPVFEELSKKYDNVHLDVYSSFLIYGWKEMDEQFNPLYDRIKNHPKMTYHGYAPQEQITEALKKAHILAYPCIWKETSCRTLMESMSAGLVCVHPNFGALPETSGGLTSMYQYVDDKNKHAAAFFQNLEHAISVVNEERIQNYLKFVKTFADMRYNIDKISQQWQYMLTDLKNRYPTEDSRKIPGKVFVYRTS